jgi:hydroxyacylglutathione hydrolase
VIFERRRYFSDNYVYLLADGADAALVDPGDASVAAELCRSRGVRPRWILHTHGHADHAGGSAELRAAFGARVLGHGEDAAFFAPDEDVAGRATLRLGALEIAVHEVPGHTPGSVLYSWRGKLLTGDTLFWAGAGNCRHGGSPARLAASFADVLARVDGTLEVHPGHDYAERNLPFALSLEPGNAAAAARLTTVRAARVAGEEPLASTLEEERAVNPFLRVGALTDELRSRGLAANDAREAFVALRRLRDGWTG